MPKHPLAQGVVIGLVAAAVGVVHSQLRPVATWESTRAADVQPSGGSGTRPSQAGNGQQPTHGASTPAPAGSGSPAHQDQAQPAAAGDGRMLTLQRVQELLAAPLPAQVVDAREPGEFALGRIPGAVNVPPSEFLGKTPDVVFSRLVRDLPVIVYCGGGNCDASKLVALRLKDLGFSQTYVYEDGFAGWTKAGLGVER